VGAIGCQLLFLALDPKTRADVASWVLSACAGACALATWRFVRVPPEASRAAVHASGSEGGGDGVARHDERPALVALALLLLLYTGVEASVAGWMNALSLESAPAHANLSFLVGALFWGALLTGRAVAPWVLARLREEALLTRSLFVSALGLAVLVATRSLVTCGVGSAVLGLGLAPIYALLASLIVARTEGTRHAGWVFAAGGVGPALLPWLGGQVAGVGGSVRAGFLVPAVGLVLMALLFGQYRRRLA